MDQNSGKPLGTFTEKDTGVGKYEAPGLFLSNIVSVIFSIIFTTLELVCRLRKILGRSENSAELNVRSIGERTIVSRQDSLQRKSSKEILCQWLETQVSYESKSYGYSTLRDVLESFLMGMCFAAHGKYCARIVLYDSDKRATSGKVTSSIKSIQARAKKSVKFRFLFKPLLEFLDDIEKSRASSVNDFIDMLAIDMLNKPADWYLDFVHSRVRAKNVAPNVYETTLATLSLFFREGAGLEAHILFGGWKSPHRAANAALTLIMYCAVMKCTPDVSHEINVTEFSGLERVLIASSDQQFRRMVSLSTTKSAELFKDKVMWDITLNCCNEFVESSWSNAQIERAAWTLQHGLKHISKELYRQLQSLHGKRKLDLTQISPLSLVVFSVSGIIKFEGLDDCIYKATAAPDAKLNLHGNLPMPTISDLLQLGIVRRLKANRFMINHLPGSDQKFKTLRVGDRIRFVRSTKEEAFTASLEQCIG